MSASINLQRTGQLLKQAKRLAIQYRQLTGKPIGITGEVGEYEAAYRLKLKLADARQEGFDAFRISGKRRIRFEVKSRVLREDADASPRLGRVRLDKQWDYVLLVLLDENYELLSIHRATRRAIQKALFEPGSKARNEHHQLGVAKFKSIGRQVWPMPSKGRGL